MRESEKPNSKVTVTSYKFNCKPFYMLSCKFAEHTNLDFFSKKMKHFQNFKNFANFTNFKTTFVAMWHDSAEMMNVQDAVIIFFQRMTIECRQRLHTSEDLSSRTERLRQVRGLVRAEPTTAVHTASITGSDPQVSAKSVPPIPISFDVLCE